MGHLGWEGVTCLCLNSVVVVEELVYLRDGGKDCPHQSNASPPEVIISTEQHGISLGWFALSVSQLQTPSQQKLWCERTHTLRLLDKLMAQALTPSTHWHYWPSVIFYFPAAFYGCSTCLIQFNQWNEGNCNIKCKIFLHYCFQDKNRIYVSEHRDISYLILTESAIPFSLDFFQTCVWMHHGSKKPQTPTASWETTPATGCCLHSRC